MKSQAPEEVLRIIDTALAAAQAPELKQLLAEARPSVEAHLRRAQDIQGKLSAGDELI